MQSNSAGLPASRNLFNHYSGPETDSMLRTRANKKTRSIVESVPLQEESDDSENKVTVHEASPTGAGALPRSSSPANSKDFAVSHEHGIPQAQPLTTGTPIGEDQPSEAPSAEQAPPGTALPPTTVYSELREAQRRRIDTVIDRFTDSAWLCYLPPEITESLLANQWILWVESFDPSKKEHEDARQVLLECHIGLLYQAIVAMPYLPAQERAALETFTLAALNNYLKLAHDIFPARMHEKISKDLARAAWSLKTLRNLLEPNTPLPIVKKKEGQKEWNVQEQRHNECTVCSFNNVVLNLPAFHGMPLIPPSDVRDFLRTPGHFGLQGFARFLMQQRLPVDASVFHMYGLPEQTIRQMNAYPAALVTLDFVVPPSPDTAASSAPQGTTHTVAFIRTGDQFVVLDSLSGQEVRRIETNDLPTAIHLFNATYGTGNPNVDVLAMQPHTPSAS